MLNIICNISQDVLWVFVLYTEYNCMFVCRSVCLYSSGRQTKQISP